MSENAAPITDTPQAARHRTFLPLTRRQRIAAVLWRLMRRLFFVPTPPSFNGLRRGLLNLFGAKIDPTAFIHSRAVIHYPWNLTIGPHSRIAYKVVLECMGPITIGAHTVISQYGHLVSGTHDYTRRDMQIICKPITIGDHVWLAADVYVNAGVSIGDHTIIGARSGVFRDIPARVVAVGNSAHPMKTLEA